MNWITAAEALIAIQAKAAPDDTDGVVISDDERLTIGRVARWLLAGAVSTGEISIGRVVDVLPTVNLDLLHRVAAEQALEMHRGEIGATCRALGVDNATFYRWRRKWKREDQTRAASIDNGGSGQSRPDHGHGGRDAGEGRVR